MQRRAHRQQSAPAAARARSAGRSSPSWCSTASPWPRWCSAICRAEPASASAVVGSSRVSVKWMRAWIDRVALRRCVAIRSIIATASTRILAGRAFRRQHDRVGAFVNGVGDVADLGPGRGRRRRSSIRASGSRPPPACRAGARAATIRFCSGGTASGGSSTPRSPRATITPSASAMISFEAVDRRRLFDLGHQRRAVADQRARLGDDPRAAGRTTRRSSRPSARARRRGRSVLVGQRRDRHHDVGDVDALMVAKSCPPTSTLVDDLGRRRPRSLASRTLPSSTRIRVPGRIASNSSGWGSSTRGRIAGRADRGRR